MDSVADNAAVNNSLNMSKTMMTPGVTSRSCLQAFNMMAGTAFKSSRLNDMT
jgi:hypothetical protein